MTYFSQPEKVDEEFDKLVDSWDPANYLVGASVLNKEGWDDDYVRTGWACHANAGYAFRKYTEVGGLWAHTHGKYPRHAKPFMLLTAFNYGETNRYSPEEQRAFNTWIAEETAPGALVTNVNRDSFLTQGAAILCGPGGATMNEMMWLCKVFRYASKEGGSSIRVWNKLVDLGVNPYIALLACSSHSSANSRSGVISKTPVAAHTSVFRPDMHKAPDPLALLNGEFNPQANQSYLSFGEIATKPGEKTSAFSKVASFCAPRKKPDGWGGFTSAGQANIKDFAEGLIKWEQELVNGKQEENLDR